MSVGLAEKRTGLVCQGAQSGFGGNKGWEEKQPAAAAALKALAEAHAQQDPSFDTSIAFTRLTAAEALRQLKAQGYREKQLPAASTMPVVLNRLGDRLRPVVKVKPKKLPETDLIFENIDLRDTEAQGQSVKRLSLECKATVKLGNRSRGGLTRGNRQADDHDRGAKETYIPCGIVDEDTGALFIGLGRSFKTRDFIADTLKSWWAQLSPSAQQQIPDQQIKVDNDPENSGVRTQFLNRIVAWVDEIGKPVHLVYYPPYHSKYNPIERCWGVLEQHWNGPKLIDVPTMLGWAQSMTWKGAHPAIELNQSIYSKGIALTKKEMRPIEQRLERSPTLPKWDILIRPA